MRFIRRKLVVAHASSLRWRIKVCRRRIETSSAGSPAIRNFAAHALGRQCHAEDLADEILAIADDSSRDYKKKAEPKAKRPGSWIGRISPAAVSGLRLAKGSWPGWHRESTSTPKRSAHQEVKGNYRFRRSSRR